MRERYVIGMDYGTGSARGVLARVSDGAIAASAEYPYGVMDRALPDGTPLPKGWALEHPADYLDAVRYIVPALLRNSGVPGEHVAGLCFDVTASTVLPTLSDGTPLCCLPRYAGRPHAYMKLWKHNSAAGQAERAGRALGPALLDRVGGRLSAESLYPKVMQMAEEDPELYGACRYIVEAGDWLAWTLTGNLRRGTCAASFKGLWSPESGWPEETFFRETGLPDRAGGRLEGEVLAQGQAAGGLKPDWAEALGLRPGMPVGTGYVDAHAAVLGCGVDGPGVLLSILGTSACHLALAEEDIPVPGIFGTARDCILPGLMAYEAGQIGFGDQLNWFVERCVPAESAREAAERGIGLHQLLTERAAALAPGQSGLLALDWWNGCRTPLLDYDLTGAVVGLTLRTRPEELYRAMLESVLFGARRVLETLESAGLEIRQIRACGGIAHKNPLMMQLFADITGREVLLMETTEASALGAAILAAAAAGEFRSLPEAVRAMGSRPEKTYRPDPGGRAAYDELYACYLDLSARLGEGNGSLMKRLLSMRG